MNISFEGRVALVTGAASGGWASPRRRLSQNQERPSRSQTGTRTLCALRPRS